MEGVPHYRVGIVGFLRTYARIHAEPLGRPLFGFEEEKMYSYGGSFSSVAS